MEPLSEQISEMDIDDDPECSVCGSRHIIPEKVHEEYCCIACYNYMAKFFHKPEQFYCLHGVCRIDESQVYASGKLKESRCKACWLNRCLDSWGFSMKRCNPFLGPSPTPFDIDVEGSELRPEPFPPRPPSPLPPMKRKPTKPPVPKCDVCQNPNAVTLDHKVFRGTMCSPCNDFFIQFAQLPKFYVCLQNENCDIQESAPKSRCKLCWLKVCVIHLVISEPAKKQFLQLISYCEENP